MSRLPKDIISVLSHVAPIFSARVWPQAQTLLIGALLAPGKRTVSGGVATTSAPKASIEIRCVPVGAILLKPVAYAGCRGCS